VRTLPIELDVRGREALAVGAGAELASKIERLIAAGARVTVVCEAPDEATVELARRGFVALAERPFEDADLEGKLVVFVAPGDPALAARLHAWAVDERRLVCTIDRPETCTFINAALVEAGGLAMTVSTAGASPGLARRIREDLGALFGEPRFARFLHVLGEARRELPRGERARAMAEAVKGFAIEARLRFPGWFERGEDPK
jgi:precorrin-2 dehydrogenase/sirohydrochlorin ferrochelatase